MLLSRRTPLVFLTALAVFFASASAVFAQDRKVGMIDSLLAPAFLDRGGLSVAAAPGVELHVGDRLRTGAGGRLLLKLAEGSAVRLGENAVFLVERARRRGALYEAGLAVVEGAFRFTTAALARAQPRDIRITVARNATIGIRGTDLWGRSRKDKDIVCLIEGKIDVTGNDNQTRQLDQPLQFFQSKRDAAPEPLSFIAPKLLAELAKETDLPTGSGVSVGGAFRIVIGGFAGRDAMLRASRTLRDAGYAADKSADNTLTLIGFNSQTEAATLAARLQTLLGVQDVRVLQ